MMDLGVVYRTGMDAKHGQQEDVPRGHDAPTHGSPCLHALTAWTATLGQPTLGQPTLGQADHGTSGHPPHTPLHERCSCVRSNRGVLRRPGPRSKRRLALPDRIDQLFVPIERGHP